MDKPRGSENESSADSLALIVSFVLSFTMFVNRTRELIRGSPCLSG